MIVERPEIRDPQAGFEALGGRCESCGTCTDSCLRKLGLEHEDGSRSPSSISPKAEKMYTFFEKSLSLVSSSPTRFGDHLAPREKRSHSLATPTAMANVVHFQELHSRHAENHLLRTVNLAASNAVLSRISARLRAVTSATQQESVEEVDEEVEKLAAQNPDLIDSILRKTNEHDASLAEGKEKALIPDAAEATPATQEQNNAAADGAEKGYLISSDELNTHNTAEETAPLIDNASQNTSFTTDAVDKSFPTTDAVDKSFPTTDAVEMSQITNVIEETSLTTEAAETSLTTETAETSLTTETAETSLTTETAETSLTTETAETSSAGDAGTAGSILNVSQRMREMTLHREEDERESMERAASGDSHRPAETIMMLTQ